MRTGRSILVLFAVVSSVAAVKIAVHHHGHNRPCLISAYGPVVGNAGKANLPGPPPIEECK